MKLIIHEPQEKKGPEVRLALRERVGSIYVCAVTPDGTMVPGGLLVEFTLDGCIRRCEMVAPDLGFNRDHAGRLKLAE